MYYCFHFLTEKEVISYDVIDLLCMSLPIPLTQTLCVYVSASIPVIAGFPVITGFQWGLPGRVPANLHQPPTFLRQLVPWWYGAVPPHHLRPSRSHGTRPGRHQPQCCLYPLHRKQHRSPPSEHRSRYSLVTLLHEHAAWGGRYFEPVSVPRRPRQGM